jgi:hypothetical protein
MQRSDFFRGESEAKTNYMNQAFKKGGYGEMNCYQKFKG